MKYLNHKLKNSEVENWIIALKDELKKVLEYN